MVCEPFETWPWQFPMLFQKARHAAGQTGQHPFERCGFEESAEAQLTNRAVQERLGGQTSQLILSQQLQILSSSLVESGTLSQFHQEAGMGNALFIQSQ